MKPISLTQGATIIETISGHRCTRSMLRNLIVRERWPYAAFRLCDHVDVSTTPGRIHPREWGVYLEDVKKFAKKYTGLKIGRPRGAEED